MLLKIRGFFGRALGRYRIVRYPYKFLKYWYLEGWSKTWNRIRRKMKGISIEDTFMYKQIFLSDDELNKQRASVFASSPIIDILVPLYNTPRIFLRDMVSSVISQTYPNWKLILTDASDTDALENEISKFRDKRIIYIRLNGNKGIAENTNQAFSYATDDYISLLDHDDMLAPQCLFEVVKRIKQGADFIYTDEITFKKNPNKDCFQPNLKPDFSPDTLRSYNYICHFICFHKSLLKNRKCFLDKNTEGSQDYDLILWLSENAKKIEHIPIPLYFWRAHNLSVAKDTNAKPYVMEAAKVALKNHLDRVGLKGKVEDGNIPTTYKIQYSIEPHKKISIIIPTCNHIDDLKKCLNSIQALSTYKNYEVIVVENNSTDSNVFAYYNALVCDTDKIKVLYYKGIFNYSKIINHAVECSDGEYLILLNNDIEVITSAWIEEQLMFAQRGDIGCVGTKLLYPDGSVQHAGIILGIGGVAGHSHKYLNKNDYGFMSRLQIVQNLSAVTAACLMVKRETFIRVGGFDTNFAVAFNDVDFCLKVRKLGLLNVYTPFAELYHFESKSRGQETTPEKVNRFNNEVKLFEKKWGLWLDDPYYNVNLSKNIEDFGLRYD